MPSQTETFIIEKWLRIFFSIKFLLEKCSMAECIKREVENCFARISGWIESQASSNLWTASFSTPSFIAEHIKTLDPQQWLFVKAQGALREAAAQMLQNYLPLRKQSYVFNRLAKLTFDWRLPNQRVLRSFSFTRGGKVTLVEIFNGSTLVEARIVCRPGGVRTSFSCTVNFLLQPNWRSYVISPNLKCHWLMEWGHDILSTFHYPCRTTPIAAWYNFRRQQRYRNIGCQSHHVQATRSEN